MDSKRKCELVSIIGLAVIVISSMLIATRPFIQAFFRVLPVIDQLPTVLISRDRLWLTGVTTLLVVFVIFIPLFKSQPRRILDTIAVAEKHVFAAVLVLAAIGYFDYSYRLPRTTLLAFSILLTITIPAWFAVLQYYSSLAHRQAIIVGDNPEYIVRMYKVSSLPIIGYVSPEQYWGPDETDQQVSAVSDGGKVMDKETNEFEHIGSLWELESIFGEYDIDIVLLAFTYPDRAEFFGALMICREYGVEAKVRYTHIDSVLTMEGDSTDASGIVNVCLNPLNWYDRIIKRGFDIVFSLIGLIILIPVIIIILIAIKLDSPGPILYSQKRTATLGETFEIYKFRTMIPNDRVATPLKDERDDRITHVGWHLRKTHLDEIPQLWSILVGTMSVVGPRAVWTDEETYIERENSLWRKRWFVKPGLTGLAQINHISSANPKEKLRYDVSYIYEQSFWFDLKIVIRQIWIVLTGG